MKKIILLLSLLFVCAEPAVAEDDLRTNTRGLSINKSISPTATDENANFNPLFKKKESPRFLKKTLFSLKKLFLFLISLSEQK